MGKNIKQFDIVLRHEGSATIVGAVGKLNIETVALFEKQLSPLLEKADRTVFMDLSGLAYIDSSGVGAMIKFNNRARLQNIKIIIYNLSDPIHKIFARAFLDKLFSIHTIATLRLTYPDIPF